MGNCYSVDQIAEDYTYSDITCNIKKPQQKCRLGPVSNRLLGGGGLKRFYWIQTLTLSFCSGSKHSIRMKVFEPSMNQHRKQTNKEYQKGKESRGRKTDK